jgi:tetratricopeptide (TPR) repeat protein
MNNLAAALYDQGAYADADAVFRNVDQAYRRLYSSNDYPEGHPDLANALNNGAATAVAMEDLDRGERLYRQALKMNEGLYDAERFPKGHPAIARSFNNLGFVRLRQGAVDEAEKLFRTSLEIRERWFEPAQYPRGHLELANSWDNLGLALMTQGALDRAEDCFRKSADMVRALVGNSHSLAASSLVHLAEVRRLQNRIEEATKTADEAWRCYQLARFRAQASGLERSGFAAQHSPGELVAVLHAKVGKAIEAWNAFEEDRGQGLLDDMVGKATRPLSVQDQTREESLIAAHGRAERSLLEASGDPGSAKNVALREACDDALADLLRFRQDLETRYGPRVGQRYSLAKIQSALPPDSAIVGWIDIAGSTKTGRGEEHWAVVLRASGEPIWMALPSLDAGGWNSRDDAVAEGG